MSRIHDRIEAIAGAIALGEARDDERREYREHLISCASCLNELGGEHEIARVADTVRAAREDEIWQPDIGNLVARRTQRRVRSLRYGASVLGLCVAISLLLNFAFVSGIAGITPRTSAPLVIDAGSTRIVLEQNPRRVQAARTATVAAAQPRPQRQMIVMHNIVSMQRAPVSSQSFASSQAQRGSAPRQIASITVHPNAAAGELGAKSNVPPWSSGSSAAWQTVATTTTTSLKETAPQSLTHSAESLQFAPVKASREASPVGGETAINPQPPMIAYDEGAQGTSVFDVYIDEHGNPSRCVITKSSGYQVLDVTVCKAAMATHYTPKVAGGRAVPGVYHDAFTFRMQDNPTIEGIPQSIKPLTP